MLYDGDLKLYLTTTTWNMNYRACMAGYYSSWEVFGAWLSRSHSFDSAMSQSLIAWIQEPV